MSEATSMEDTTTASNSVPEEQAGPQVISLMPEDRHRAEMAARIILIGGVFSGIAMIPYVPLYLQTGAWQIIFGVGGIILGALCLVPARSMAKRGRVEASGYWVLAALAITFGAGELAWSDATLNQTASFILLILLAATVFRPRRWGIWLVSTAAFLLFVYAVNQFVPWQRFDIMQRSPASQATPIVLMLVLVWQISRGLAFGTIRIRLLTAFIATTLTVALVVGGLSAASALDSGQDLVLAQLESVATIKEAEIETWTQTLLTSLGTLATEESVISRVGDLALSGEAAPGEVQAAYTGLQDRLQQVIDQAQHFSELFLIDSEGNVVLATNPMREGGIYARERYFQRGLEAAYVQPLSFSPIAAATRDTARVALLIAHPIVDPSGQTIAVLTGLADTDALRVVMLERAGLGETGETYLVGSNYALLTESQDTSTVYVRTEATITAIQNRVDGSGTYSGYLGDEVVGVYRWLPDLEVVLVAERSQSEAFLSIYTTWALSAGLGIVAVLLTTGLALLITRNITRPVAELVEVVEQVTAGDLDRTADVIRQDEIGTLARAFNTMTAQLRGLIGTLEQRVADRTGELERRSGYLEASAEVARAVASILDVDVLIRQTVELIRERFDLYYVGLFLVDESGRWAVLRAGTGEAGRKMIARGHRHRVGDGMIGWSIAHAEARVALEADEDTVRLTTAELPHTRSEAALPLHSRNRVIGALTVQHTEPGTFDQETVTLLQIMADQVAIAIDNAYLFEESQEALEATRRAYGELSRTAWTDLLSARTDLSFRSSIQGVTATEDSLSPEIEQALAAGHTVRLGLNRSEGKYALAVPIKIRGSVIGALDTYKPVDEGEWTPDEISLLEVMAEQLGNALESARLYEDAQRRAARERLTREITERMRSTTEVQNIIQAAVDDLFGVLDASRIYVRLGQSLDSNDDGTDGREAP
jgi:GAF domain-containing protein/HAMP domain-containing protein